MPIARNISFSFETIFLSVLKKHLKIDLKISQISNLKPKEITHEIMFVKLKFKRRHYRHGKFRERKFKTYNMFIHNSRS